MLSYIQLKSFVVLCDTGSFSKAALQMATNQPSITKRIQQIESYLDKTLLYRQTNGKEISLTEDGEIFLLYAEKIIKSYELLDEAFNEENEDIARLTIGSVKGFFHFELSNKIKELSETYPKLGISVEIRGTDELIAELKNKTLDIVFVVSDNSNAEIDAKFIKYLDMGWYASEELYKKISKINDVLEIYARFPVLLCKENSLAIDIVKRTFKNNNIKNYTIQLSDSMQTMVESVNNGFGIGYLPKKFAAWENERKSEKLVELNLLLIQGLSIYSAILKNSNKKQYYDFLTSRLE